MELGNLLSGLTVNLRKNNFMIIDFALKKINPIKYWRAKGATIGDDCRLVGNVDLGTEPYLVKIGNHVSITRSIIITHDGGVWVARKKSPELDVFGSVEICDNVFIGANCIILPGVKIGSDVVVGAGSVVTKDLASGGVYAGVPARLLRPIESYIESCKIHSVPTKHMNSEQKREYLLNVDYKL
jgi:acetyltransferase-like isoleucine patch superfamily enzyme